MKKILLGLGTITAVAVPTVAVVSCSLGSVFKSKINSIEEAKKDVLEIFRQLSDKGTLNSEMDKYTSKFSAKDVLDFEDDISKDDVIGMTYDISNLEINQGKRVGGFRDWTASHNDLYSVIKVKLSDGTDAFASVYFRYDKTNGVWAGRSKGAWLVNGVIAAGNYATKMKHVISDITISKTNVYIPF